MDTKTATANKVVAALEGGGVSHLELSQTTGIARTTLLRKLQGVVPFNVVELGRIADALAVDPLTLVEFRGVA